MLKVAINGLFCTMRMQGIVRFARELTIALDEILESGDQVELLVPYGEADIPELSNIVVKRIGHLRGKAWEQIDLAVYMTMNPSKQLLNLCNVAPLIARPGVTAIHDVMYRACPEFYTTIRNRISRLWHCIQYGILTHRENRIITVSEFSKEEIEKYYPTSKNKTDVVYDSWEHVLRYRESKDWEERYPALEPGKYLFSMATLARNKNGRWVYEVAKRNPDVLFAIAGKRYELDEIEKPKNVILLGYISDSDAAALIHNSKAFIFPSLYEGFGLPPLEALALGAPVISSNLTSLYEVLGEAVHYIDPLSYNIDIESLLAEATVDKSETLNRYAWAKSAQQLYRILDTCIGRKP